MSTGGPAAAIRAAQGGARAQTGAGEGRGPDAGPQPQPQPWVADLSAYVGGESSLAGVERVIKLASNENPLGPSPRAIDGFRRAGENLALYPDGAAKALRGAIASVHEIDVERIVCGAGSDELIALLVRAFCAPGDEVVHCARGFAMYRLSAQGAGAKPVAAPVAAPRLSADPDAFLSVVGPRTKLVFLANPNNPTGDYLSGAEIRRLADALPPTTLLVIDGAYAEYMRAPDYDPGFALVDAAPNVAVTRTFSKIHGLAALRVGWLYGSAVVAGALNRLRGPFNVSAPALAAAEAAVRDTAYAEACAVQNEVWRDWLVKQLRAAGVDTPESHGNFVLPRFEASGRRGASAADAFLRAQGVLVRRMEGYGMPDRLRITVGASTDNVIVAKALAAFMAESGGPVAV